MARHFSTDARDLFTRIISDACPVVIDIRIPEDIARDDGWMPAAHRVAFGDLEKLMTLAAAADEAIIVCQGGLKLSQGVAARLAVRGCRAGFLAGGLVGWRGAGLPLMQAQPGIWVTGSADTASAIAAHWLADRLLPRPSELLQVAPDQVALAAERFAGTPLPDAPGLLALLDRPVSALRSTLDFACGPDFARLARGFGFDARAMSALDAWTLGEGVAT